MTATITGAIGVVVDLIKTAAGNLPEAKFVIVMPITRPAVKWFTENFDMIHKYYGEII